MGARIETKKGFVDHFIDCSIDPASFLAKIEALVDWKPFENYLKKNIKRGPAAAGQPPYPDLVMFKVLLLQFWYGLSDDGASQAVRDRISFMHFLGLPFDSSKPDGSTICRFRNRLLEKGHYQKLLELFNQRLTKNGLLVKRGAVVDATLVESSRRPRKVMDMEGWSADYEEEGLSGESEEPLSIKVSYSRDVEASWTVKCGRPVYGYKAHVAVDEEHGFILGGHITGANVSDTTEMAQVVTESGLPVGAMVIADKGYAGEPNRRYLAEKGYRDGIMSKAYRNRPLSEKEKKRNAGLSKIRWIVERSFGTLKKVQGFMRARYLGRAKIELELYFQALAHNMRKAINLSA
jgi:IS5 family transposase